MATKDLTTAELETLRKMLHNLWHSETGDPIQKAIAHLAYEQCDNLLKGKGGPALPELQLRTLRELYDAFGGRQ